MSLASSGVPRYDMPNSRRAKSETSLKLVLLKFIRIRAIRYAKALRPL